VVVAFHADGVASGVGGADYAGGAGAYWDEGGGAAYCFALGVAGCVDGADLGRDEVGRGAY